VTEEVLEAPHVLSYDYTRSTGPVIGTFLAGLRDRRVLGIRGSDGRVLVPPQEYDPVTSQSLDQWVEVAAEGVVASWAWNPTPRPGQAFDRPFAWALVRLDGADTTMLHALDVSAPDQVATGQRVRIRWSDEPQGRITDIACFELARNTDENAGEPTT
jgi:uncharacterized OB-fold protein